VDGTEGASGLDQLHQFGVAGEKPLQAVRCRWTGAERKVRGEPKGSRLSTGAPAEETAGSEVEGGGDQVGVEGTGGGGEGGCR
jgi:hypothetical protein